MHVTKGMDKGGLFAGIVWGLEEEDILTAGVVTDGGLLLDELHITIEDEKVCFRNVKSFLGRWRIKQVHVEDLSDLQEMKSRVDGPLSIESYAWKRKMETCVSILERVRELGIEIKFVREQ